MKKSLFTLAFLLLFLGLIKFPITLADNTVNYPNLPEIIKNLQGIIKNLNDQINYLTSEVAVLRVRLNFSRELKLGMSGSDVKQLQQILVDKVPDDISQDLITGYFGPHTQNALKKLQGDQALKPSGVLDSETRDRLAALAEAETTPSEPNYLNLKITTSTKTTISNFLLPTVYITYPTQGSIINGSINVSATIKQGAFPILAIQFSVDGATLGAPITYTPYTLYWDTTTVEDGTHTISAIVTDGSGSEVNAGAITFNVSNNNTPPPGLSSQPAQLTPSVQPITISNVQAINITKTTSTITWTTNSPASSEVDYSKNSNPSVNQILKAANSFMTSNHSIVLNNLSSGTNYYYYVLSTDVNNQTASSSIFSFTTNH